MKIKNKVFFLIFFLVSCKAIYNPLELIEEGILEKKDFDAHTPYSKNKSFKVEHKNIINLDDPQIKFVGNWIEESDTKSTNLKIKKTTSNITKDEVKKTKITYKFIGNTIEYLATKDKDQGFVEIYLDNEFKGKYDLFSKDKLNRQIIFSQSDLKIKEHIIEIIPSGDKNDLSDNLGINLDTFINNWPRQDIGIPKVNFFSNGDFLVSWLVNEIIYTQVFKADGSKKTSVLKQYYKNEILDKELRLNISNDIIINDKDEIIIIWIDSTNGEQNSNRLFFKKFNSNLDFIKEGSLNFPVDRSAKNYSYTYNFEKIDKNKIVCYFNDSRKASINIFDDELNLIKKDIELAPIFESKLNNIKIISNNNGNFLVVWYYEKKYGNNISFGLYGRFFNENFNAIGKEFPINELVSNDKTDFSIAMDKDGNFVVVWHSSSLIWHSDIGKGGKYDDIYARTFDKNGKPLTGDFLVNTTTINDQEEPNVIINDSGNIYFSWINRYEELNPDNYIKNTFSNVYGQVFNIKGEKIGSEFQFSDLEKSKRSNTILKTFNNKVYSFWKQDKDNSNGAYSYSEDSIGIFFNILN